MEDSQQAREKNYLTRLRIVKELVEKEEEYVRDLKSVATLILRLRQAVDQEKPILTLDEILRLFANLDTIAKCHEDLLNAFRARMKEWTDNPNIGDIFLNKELFGFVKLYKHYLAARTQQCTTLTEVCASRPLFLISLTVRSLFTLC